MQSSSPAVEADELLPQRGGDGKRSRERLRVTMNENAHLCASTERVITKMPSYQWVADKSICLLKQNPNMGPGELKSSLEQKYKCQIGYGTVAKGKSKALDQIYGSWEDSFQMLVSFMAEVEDKIPGSVVELSVELDMDGNDRFQRFFCCLKPSIDGFVNGCRPFLSIDSTHLNGRWNGQLASAIAFDGHNWMFPLAFAFFGSETTDNWTWFMGCVKKAIRNRVENLAISSDACKGLENAIKTEFPWAEHRECFRHLMDNFQKQFQGPAFGNLYPAARAYRQDRYEHYMANVAAASHKAIPWLNKYHSMTWMRYQFREEIKCDYITNNLAESWNSWIKDIKDLPVADLADTIRSRIMQLYHRRRKLGERFPDGEGCMLPAVVNQLNAMTRHVGNLKVEEGAFNSAEVTEITDELQLCRQVVQLDKHECTCREWQISGKPCAHALAFISTKRNIRTVKMDHYLSHYYSVKNFRLAYAGIIPPLTDKSQWPKIDYCKVMYPLQKKSSAGRKRKNRIVGEFEKSKKKSKGKWQVKCKGCGEMGHRQTSAKCRLNGTKKRKRTKKTGRPSRADMAPGEDCSQVTTPSTAMPAMPSGEGCSEITTPPRARREGGSHYVEGSSQMTSPPRPVLSRAAKTAALKKLTPKKKN